ncbi:hypothetical protein CBF34_00765 [Vagococcus penaei]|uniref:Uncharacterized protein n=1 Tax=Vagococcus penaei TaxID=633807 RepID=A0A1Q2D5U4_9ENTE|nr:hypothetical protein [Vagococcus penaei]AQP53627.1 hypothetical protein BW732_04845 [Vagococcus penaei]RSU07572.1 hypothetical protein CBF34_00765 [Vagococcus penaei]
MTTFYIHQDILSANVRTVVTDEQQKIRYLMVGRWGVKGDSLSIYHLNGTILASVKQKSFSLIQQFDLFENHQLVGYMSRVLRFPKDVYIVRGLRWLIVGSQQSQYKVYYLNKLIMTVDKVVLTKGNFYRIAIENEEHTELCLCVAAVLDYWARSPHLLKLKKPLWAQRLDLSPSC